MGGLARLGKPSAWFIADTHESMKNKRLECKKAIPISNLKMNF